MTHDVQRVGSRVDVRCGAHDPICVIGIGWISANEAASLAGQIRRALEVCRVHGLTKLGAETSG